MGERVASSQPIRWAIESLTVQGSHSVGVDHSSSVSERMVPRSDASICSPRDTHSEWVGFGRSSRRVTVWAIALGGGGIELQGAGIDAEPLALRTGTIVEDMTEVTTARLAHDFR